MTRQRLFGLLALTILPAQAVWADIRFENANHAFPLTHVYDGAWEHFVGGGVAVFDCNADARPDLFVAGGSNRARLFVNQPGDDLSFENKADLPELVGVTGAYPLDFNNDAQIDLMVLRVGQNQILRGDGECRFTDVSEDWGFHSEDQWSTAFTATWESGQAWPTLAIGNYVDRSDPDGPFEACDVNALYRPDGTGYQKAIALEPGFCALSMLFSDWARSGAAELRISNDRHYYVRGGYEQMWRLDPLTERDETDGWAPVSIWGMGIASADLERDGFPDVMLTSMGDQVLHLNDAGRIEAAKFSKGVSAHRPHIGDDGRPSTGWHAEFGDIDNDGLQDLFIAKGNVDQMPSNAMKDPNNLLMQQPDGTFVEVAAEAGMASTDRGRGAALADFDQDGRLDIVVVNRRAPLELWLNRSAKTGNQISIDLRQSGTNTFAIGAWLEIKRGDQSEWRERTLGGGHVSGSLLPLHIGLGAEDTVEMRVWWPDGAVSPWQTYRAGANLVLQR